jgi:hypothetical protein
MNRNRPTIYIASKAHHGAKWKELIDHWERSEHEYKPQFIMTWIHESEPGETSDWTRLWSGCIYEAGAADYFIAYFEEGETHSGLFVELGAALAEGRQVYAVNMPNYKIGKYAMINHVQDMGQAVGAILGDWRTRIMTADPVTRFSLTVSIPNEELPPVPICQKLINFAERSLRAELIATALKYKLEAVTQVQTQLGNEYATIQANLSAAAET